MVLDSSAIVAIAAQETGYEVLMARINTAPGPILIGAPTAVESIMVLSRRMGTNASAWVSGFLRSLDAEVVPFGEQHFDAAARAFMRFGKGRHPASLNFGDCMSYAIARVAKAPLLYTGNDFSKTDIEAA
jgi:ribonuclease VapC